MIDNPQKIEIPTPNTSPWHKTARFIAGLFFGLLIPLLIFFGSAVLDPCGTALSIVAQGECAGDVLGTSELTVLLSFLATLVVLGLISILLRRRFKYFMQGLVSALIIFILLSILLWIKFS